MFPHQELSQYPNQFYVHCFLKSLLSPDPLLTFGLWRGCALRIWGWHWQGQAGIAQIPGAGKPRLARAWQGRRTGGRAGRPQGAGIFVSTSSVTGDAVTQHPCVMVAHKVHLPSLRGFGFMGVCVWPWKEMGVCTLWHWSAPDACVLGEWCEPGLHAHLFFCPVTST